MSIRVPFRSPWPIVAGFLLLVCCGAAAAGLLWAQDYSNRWVRHTVEVRARLAESRIVGLRAEVNRRGYLLTGNARDREAARTNLAAAARELAALHAMTADNPRQRRTLAALDQALAARFADAERSMRLAAVNPATPAARALDNRETRALTARIIALMNRAGAEEARLLREREARSRRLQALARIVLAAGVFLILLLAQMMWRDRRHRLRALAQANAQLARDIRRREVAEAQLRLLAANATDAVFRVSLDGRFLYASPSTRQVFGVDPEVVVGQELHLGVHRDDLPALTEGLQLLARGEQERLVLTYRVRRADAPKLWRWVESTVGLVRDHNGQPAEIISSIRDVSERKELEIALEAARVRAEEAAEAKSGFLAAMSHEIRTPMNGVIGFTELLLAGELAPDQRRQVELIADSGRAMMRLLNDILDWSKVEAGQMRVASEPLDLRHAMRACVRLVAPAAAQKGLDLRLDAADDLPARICGDGLRVRQVLLNLLGNAVKFTLAGAITVRAVAMEGPTGPELAITVADTGIGIAPERQQAVFEAFVQAEQGTTARFGGTGLGLPISARLAELMGGRLTLESAPGRGARFTLSLPLLMDDCGDGQVLPIASPTPASESDGDRPLRVLVAEDHDVNQLLVAAMLRRLGVEPDLAADGEQALSMVAAARAGGRPYQLLLMDMQMPVMDGPDAARRLRAAGVGADELPIVALTANAYAEDIAQCLAAGMQAHLAKPVTLADLDGALRRWAAAAPTPALPAAATGPSTALQERYRQRRAECLAAVDALATADAPDDAACEVVAGLLHKLAGVAANFGEPRLGDLARGLEDGLKNWPAAERPGRIREGAAALRAAADHGTRRRAAG